MTFLNSLLSSRKSNFVLVFHRDFGKSRRGVHKMPHPMSRDAFERVRLVGLTAISGKTDRVNFRMKIIFLATIVVSGVLGVPTKGRKVHSPK